MLRLDIIINLLDKIPIWRILKSLPKKVEELESEVDLLKKEIASFSKYHVLAQRCPQCRENSVFLDPEVFIKESEEGNALQFRRWICENDACRNVIEQYKNSGDKFDDGFWK